MPGADRPMSSETFEEKWPIAKRQAQGLPTTFLKALEAAATSKNFAQPESNLFSTMNATLQGKGGIEMAVERMKKVLKSGKAESVMLFRKVK